MKVKILKLGEEANEVIVEQGATVQHVIQASGFNRDDQAITFNGHATFDSSPAQNGDVMIMNPHIKEVIY